MPRFNSRGQCVAGVGDGIVSIDKRAVASGGAACWLDDDRVIFGGHDVDGSWRTLTYDQRNALTLRLAPAAAQFVVGSAGEWGVVGPDGFVGAKPLDPSVRLSLASTDSRGAADRQGSIAITGQDGIGFTLVAADGSTVSGAVGFPAYHLTVVSSTQAIWPSGNGFATLNLPVPTVAGRPGRACWCDVDGHSWVVYACDGIGLIAHPIDDASQGVILETAGQSFHYDAIAINGTIRVCYAASPAERPEEVIIRDLDLSVLVPLHVDVPIPAIGKPCYLGWFRFGDVATDAPGNCDLHVDADMLVRIGGQVVAQYVAAESVGTADALDAAIAAAHRARPDVPVVCYWTRLAQRGRLPRGAEIIGIEAYRQVDERLDAFEQRVRSAVAVCPRAWLIGQCYTSNANNAPDLRAVVPVYARIAQDSPNVDGILVFSAGTRPTGWDAHSEVHGAWRELFAGIPSAPIPVPRPTPPPIPIPAPKPPPPAPVPVPVPTEEDPMIAYGTPVPGFAPGQIEDNGNGTVSVKKPNGKYLCVTPDGHPEERPSGGGPWESFKKGKNALIAERDGGSKGPQVYVLPMAEA